MLGAHRVVFGIALAAAAAALGVACSDAGDGDTGGADAGGFANDGAPALPTPRDAGAGDARSPGALDAGAPTFDAATDGAPDDGLDAGDTRDTSAPDPVDAADAAPLTCAVRFTVTGAIGADAATDGFYLVGGGTELGSWQPSASMPLVQKAPDTWSGAITLADGAALEFKFIERGAASVTWEDWGLYSNRSMVVRCPTGATVADAATRDASTDDAGASDAGISDAGISDAGISGAGISDAGISDGAVTDAAGSDAGDASDASAPRGPVVGDAYTGVFNVKPGDAT